MNKDFWRIVGARRTRNFGIVVVINAILVALLIMWQIPKKEALHLQEQQTERRKLDLQNQIVELPKKYEVMQKNEEAYEAMRLRGYFTDQDRIVFRQLLNDLRLATKVRQVAYDIKPLTVIANQALSNTDVELLRSDVSVTLRSATDMEMREFVRVLQDSTPGFSAIKQQEFTRLEDLNDLNLIKFGNGEPVDFIESKYTFEWFTLRDKVDPLDMQAIQGAGQPHAMGVQ